MVRRSHLFHFLFRRTIAYIVFSILVVTIPMFVMLSIYSNQEAAKYSNENIHLISQELDSFFHSVEDIESVFSTENDVRIPLTLYAIMPHYDESYTSDAFNHAYRDLKNLIMFQNGLQFCVVGQQGHLPIRYTTENVNGNFLPKNAVWYKTVSDAPYKSHVLFNNSREYYTSAKNAISVIRAITNIQTGKPVSFVIIDISYQAFRDMIEKKIDPNLPVEIRDPSGILLYSNIKGPTSDQGNQNHIYRQVSDYSGISVTTYVSKPLFIREISKIILFMVIIMFLYLMAVFVVSIVSTRRFTSSIYSLIEEMKQVIKGSLDTSVEYKGKIIEIDDLYRSFNFLVAGMKDLIRTNYEINLMKTQAELNALQEKINPHFLYNALETISSQAIIDGSKSASRMCQKLGALFSYSLQEQDIVTLSQEINQIKNYLYITENCVQYQNIEIYYLIDRSTNNQLIPKMALQPLLENCIKHGFNRLTNKSRYIEIKSSIIDDCVQLRISDNGNGMSDDQLRQLKEDLSTPVSVTSKSTYSKIGLRHVHTRLSLYYGEKYSLDIDSAPNEGTTIFLTIPFMEKRQEGNSNAL